MNAPPPLPFVFLICAEVSTKMSKKVANFSGFQDLLKVLRTEELMTAIFIGNFQRLRIEIWPFLGTTGNSSNLKKKAENFSPSILRNHSTFTLCYMFIHKKRVWGRRTIYILYIAASPLLCPSSPILYA